MKIQLTYLLLLIALNACKTKREAHEANRIATQTQSELRANALWSQLTYQDSSYRYWYYAGDSTFFFHPDLGLWSKSGQFTYRDQNGSYTKDEKIRLQYDSLGVEKAKLRLGNSKSWTRHSMFNWYSLLLLLCILVAIYWIIQNRINLR